MRNLLFAGYFVLLMVFVGSCSKEEPSPPFIPEVECRIASISTDDPNGFSYEFFYDDDGRLSSMRRTLPASPWPASFSFRYSGGQLVGINFTLGNDFPNFDSVTMQFFYDDQDRPVKMMAETHLRGLVLYEGARLVAYEDQKFTINTEGNSDEPYSTFYLDGDGNIAIREDYDDHGKLYRVEERTFDNNPSPYRHFPAALKLFLDISLHGSWVNNVTRSRLTEPSVNDLQIEKFVYTYNAAGFPSTASGVDGARVYRYRYLNCQ